jgi:hypothetical protein
LVHLVSSFIAYVVPSYKLTLVACGACRGMKFSLARLFRCIHSPTLESPLFAALQSNLWPVLRRSTSMIFGYWDVCNYGFPCIVHPMSRSNNVDEFYPTFPPRIIESLEILGVPANWPVPKAPLHPHRTLPPREITDLSEGRGALSMKASQGHIPIVTACLDWFGARSRDVSPCLRFDPRPPPHRTEL